MHFVSHFSWQESTTLFGRKHQPSTMLSFLLRLSSALEIMSSVGMWNITFSAQNNPVSPRNQLPCLHCRCNPQDTIWNPGRFFRGSSVNKCPANRAICAMSITEWKDASFWHKIEKDYTHLGLSQHDSPMVCTIGYKPKLLFWWEQSCCMITTFFCNATTITTWWLQWCSPFYILMYTKLNASFFPFPDFPFMQMWLIHVAEEFRQRHLHHADNEGRPGFSPGQRLGSQGLVSHLGEMQFIRKRMNHK